MRGKGKTYGIWWKGEGITPAHAGKRQLRIYAGSFPRDHPRTCGEKFYDDEGIKLALGSPPHMRGKEAAMRKHMRKVGITPAHAGKSYPIFMWHSTARDHPRTCGEKRTVHSRSSYLLGSPPHMRGKVSCGQGFTRPCRITPAHAGKRAVYFVPAISQGDHPRTCGEKFHKLYKFFEILGSPPHMRGKGVRLSSGGLPNGITPAHAGKSYRLICKWYKTWDHPRTCGEKWWVSPSTRRITGSPPHMRGKV